jgi:hypothetical protein
MIYLYFSFCSPCDNWTLHSYLQIGIRIYIYITLDVCHYEDDECEDVDCGGLWLFCGGLWVVCGASDEGDSTVDVWSFVGTS